MFKLVTLLPLVAVAGIGVLLVTDDRQSASAAPPTVYDFKMKDIDGNEVKLRKFKGSVLLIVNTASNCGYTPQYESLQTTYEKYKDKGFFVLGFPSNNFNNQEPGTDAEIKEFCTSKYNVSFPMFAKITVKGADKDPLYAYLTDLKIHPVHGGDITWNFNKFLVDKKGRVVGRFNSKEQSTGAMITAAIEEHLEAD